MQLTEEQNEIVKMQHERDDRLVVQEYAETGNAITLFELTVAMPKKNTAFPEKSSFLKSLSHRWSP